MQRYSFLSLARHALGRHRGWQPLWRKPAPQAALSRSSSSAAAGTGWRPPITSPRSTASRDVAVLEKGPIGLGNTGRNTTIIRSNYLWDESARLYEHSLKLWEGLSAELNFNLMLSQRGVLNLAHNAGRYPRGDAAGQRQPRSTASTPNGSSRTRSSASARSSTSRADARYPILGATLQRRGGVARHDAVAWGYARAADALGVDIIENCEVTGDPHRGRAGSPASRRPAATIAADKVAIAAAGHNSVLAAMAGVRLPLQSHPLQALVSEPIKPVLDCVVMSNTVHVYVSQSDKGELVMGAGIDAFNSYAQRGSFPIIEAQMAARAGAVPDLLAAADDAQLGRHRRCRAGCLADHRQAAGRRGSISTAAGAPAGSRRRRAPARSSPTRSPTTSRTRSRRRSRSTASRPAR